MICECFYCLRGEAHPDRHNEFYPTTHELLVAESLAPADSVAMEACVTCGHVRPGGASA